MSNDPDGEAGLNEADPTLDLLLQALLRLDDRPPDPAFVARVGAAVAEAERYAKWKAGMLRMLLGELLAIAGVAGAIVVVSQAPGVGEAVGRAPGLVWPALLSLLLLWMSLVRGPSRLLT